MNRIRRGDLKRLLRRKAPARRIGRADDDRVPAQGQVRRQIGAPHVVADRGIRQPRRGHRPVGIILGQVKRGLGGVKAGANYIASLRAAEDAKARVLEAVRAARP